MNACHRRAVFRSQEACTEQKKWLLRESRLIALQPNTSQQPQDNSRCGGFQDPRALALTQHWTMDTGSSSPVTQCMPCSAQSQGHLMLCVVLLFSHGCMHTTTYELVSRSGRCTSSGAAGTTPVRTTEARTAKSTRVT